MSHPLLPMPERLKEADEQYAVLGRALAYATEFEKNCRRLAHLLDISDAERDFGFELYKMMKKGTLLEKINLAVSKHSLPEWTALKIDEARKGRNYIAHEAAENHVNEMKTEVSRRYFYANVMSAAASIAEGNQIVLDYIMVVQSLKEIEFGSEIVEYQFSVSAWIGSSIQDYYRVTSEVQSTSGASEILAEA